MKHYTKLLPYFYVVLTAVTVITLTCFLTKKEPAKETLPTAESITSIVNEETTVTPTEDTTTTAADAHDVVLNISAGFSNTESIRQIRYDYEEEAIVLAKVVYCEARGIRNVTEQANVIWTILNRYEAGYGNSIIEVATSPKQFAYRDDAPTVDDYGKDLVDLAKRILCYWAYGDDNGIFRTLPNDYYYFRGHDGHNWFFNDYSDFTNKIYINAYNYYLGYLAETVED